MQNPLCLTKDFALFGGGGGGGVFWGGVNVSPKTFQNLGECFGERN
jgi:hypothetical protein